MKNLMNLILFLFLAVNAEDVVWKEDRKTVLWDRLKAYQNLTGISDEKIDEIWKMRNDYTRQGNIPMAQVNTYDKIPTGNPAVFSGISFNEGMIYNNGVFLIMEPGYYRIDVNLRMGYESKFKAAIGYSLENLAYRP